LLIKHWRRKDKEFLINNTKLELSDVLSKSLELISDMTSYTSVVLDKKSHDNKLKEISIVPVNESLVVVIVITDQGYVEHKNVYIPNVDLDDVKKNGLKKKLKRQGALVHVSRFTACHECKRRACCE